MGFFSRKLAETRSRAKRLAQAHVEARAEAELADEALVRATETRAAAAAAETRARAAAAKANRKAGVAKKQAERAQWWANRWESPGWNFVLPGTIAGAFAGLLLLAVIMANVDVPATSTVDKNPETITPAVAVPTFAATRTSGAADAERQRDNFAADLERREVEAEARRAKAVASAAMMRREQTLAEIARRGAENRAKIEAERRALIERERPVNQACDRAETEFLEAENQGETLPVVTKRVLTACALDRRPDRLTAVEAVLPEFQDYWRARLEAERQEAERQARLEAERRQAEEERRRQVALEEERQRREAERQARLEAERQEAERQAQLESERQEAEQQARAELWASAKTITYDDLFRNNEQHIGNRVKFRGKIVQVLEGLGDRFEMRVNVTWTGFLWEDTVYVHYRGPRLLEDDLIDFVGSVDGLVTYESIFGAQITIPEITILEAELVGG